jgi:uncharacterized protein (DUF488 family)
VRARPLFTIGYEGADLDDFLTTLAASGVAQIIDIREVPLSRKRGFSKKALTDALAASNIAYVHIKELGDPKPGREAARRGEFRVFRKIYREHLKSAGAQAALEIATQLAGEMPSCLLCFERAHPSCHRSIVAKAIHEKASFAISHLKVRKDAVSHCNGSKKSSRDSQLAFW